MKNADPVLAKTLNRRIPPSHVVGDWSRVLAAAGTIREEERRSRQSRWGRRGVVVALAAAAAIVVSSAALGLSGRGYELFESNDPAPARVVQSFASLERSAPSGMAPQVIPGATRTVVARDLPTGDSTSLWVAPTATGGFCWQLGFVTDAGAPRGSSGGCNDRQQVVSATLTIPGPVRAETIARSTVAISGAVVGNEVDRLELRFADGDRVAIPLTWVSTPIDAGLFVYGVRSGDLQPTTAPTQLVAVDRGGRPVGDYHFDFAQILARLRG